MAEVLSRFREYGLHRTRFRYVRHIYAPGLRRRVCCGWDRQNALALVGIEASKIAAVTFVVPFLFLLYPRMLAAGGPLAIADAIASGVLFVFAFAMLFGNARITGSGALDILACIAMAAFAIAPYRIGLLASAIIGIALFMMWRKRLAVTTVMA